MDLPEEYKRAENDTHMLKKFNTGCSQNLLSQIAFY